MRREAETEVNGDVQTVKAGVNQRFKISLKLECVNKINRALLFLKFSKL